MNKAKLEEKNKIGYRERSLSFLQILVENSMHVSKDKKKVKASIVAGVQLKNRNATCADSFNRLVYTC